MEVFPALSACSLFAGLTQDEITAILPCLSARQTGFRRGQFLLRAGDEVRFAGVVLAGEVELLQEDFWGNRNLLAAAGPGELFAEAFACVQARAPVSVLCKTDGRVLYLDTHAIFSPCEKGCAQHRTLSQNLIRVLAEKNMQLNEKAGYLSQRSTREKLLAYLRRRAGPAAPASASPSTASSWRISCRSTAARCPPSSPRCSARGCCAPSAATSRFSSRNDLHPPAFFLLFPAGRDILKLAGSRAAKYEERKDLYRNEYCIPGSDPRPGA